MAGATGSDPLPSPIQARHHRTGDSAQQGRILEQVLPAGGNASMSKKTTRPPDREDRKFSATIAEFIDGYMDHDEPRWEVRQNYINVACIAWNIAELALHEHEKAIHAYLDMYRTRNPGSMESTPPKNPEPNPETPRLSQANSQCSQGNSASIQT